MSVQTECDSSLGEVLLKRLLGLIESGDITIPGVKLERPMQYDGPCRYSPVTVTAGVHLAIDINTQRGIHSIASVLDDTVEAEGEVTA